MSSLWTPGGEHPVGDDPQARQAPPDAAPAGPGDEADPLAGLSAEEREQAEEMAAQMADVQRQLLELPHPRRWWPTTRWGSTSWPPSTCRPKSRRSTPPAWPSTP